MRKTILLTLCSFFLLSCSASLSSSGKGGISFPGNSSSAQSSGGGGIPWGNSSSSSAATSGGGIPWGNSSTSQQTSKEGHTSTYPSDNVRNFLNTYGINDVTIPSFDAESFTFEVTVAEGYPFFLVQGWFSTQEKAANAGNSYLGTLNDTGAWTLYDYMDQGGYVIAMHSNNLVAIQIAITQDNNEYALNTGIFVNTQAQTSQGRTSQGQSTSADQFLAQFPSQELNAFMNAHGVGSVSIPHFTAEKYDYYSETVDMYPDFTVVGLFATEDAGVTATNNYLSVLDADANWTLYNYWDEGGYFAALHSGNKVALMITYNYYDQINYYALEVTVVINEQAQPSQSQGQSSVGYNEFYTTSGFPSSVISSFLANIGISGVSIPAFTGASRYGYFMMQINYSASAYMETLYVVGIYPSKDAGVRAIEAYQSTLIGAGLECDMVNNNGEIILTGGSGSLLYAVMGYDPADIPVGISASSGEYAVLIGLAKNPEM